MRVFNINYVVALIVLGFTTINIFGQENTDRRPPKEKWDYVIIQATVEALDMATREVTLRGPQGNLVTITVDESVQRFDEIGLHDVVTAEYWTYMLAEFRNPTAEELAEPLFVLAEGGKAPEGMDPSAEVGAVVKAVVTIEIINRPDMLVTIKGPMGNYLTIEMEDWELIERLNVGEVVVLTYAEALALSLEKVNPYE